MNNNDGKHKTRIRVRHQPSSRSIGTAADKSSSATTGRMKGILLRKGFGLRPTMSEDEGRGEGESGGRGEKTKDKRNKE